MIIKNKTILLIFVLLIINITLTSILYIPPIDMELVKELTSTSLTGGLGFYLISISSDINVFIFCLLLEGIIYMAIENVKENYSICN